MPEDNFTDLQALLRLKRYETPPPDFYEDFLVEFHHRQRAELLRRPLWRIALDRLGNFVPMMPALPMPNLAYAGTGALALVAAVGLVSRQVSVSTTHGGPTLAAAANASPAAANAALTAVAPAVRSEAASAFFAAPMDVRLSSRGMELAGDDVEEVPAVRFTRAGTVGNVQNAQAAAFGSRPRYLLESQPVRYELRSTSF